MDDNDPISNPSHNEHFADVVAARVGRRAFLGGGLALAAASMTGVDTLLRAHPAGAGGALSQDESGNVDDAGPLLGFQGIPTSTADVVVPAGYSAKVLIAWGDPVSDGPVFNRTPATARPTRPSSGACTTTASCTSPSGARHAVCSCRTTSTPTTGCSSPTALPPGAPRRRARLNAHGVGIIEISKQRGGVWHVVRPSPYARRITGQTPITIGGPAAGDPRLRTSADPNGTEVLGTLNNCAMGFTPWGTYLACEENFNGYFRTTSPTAARRSRSGYGIAPNGNPGCELLARPKRASTPTWSRTSPTASAGWWRSTRSTRRRSPSSARRSVA